MRKLILTRSEFGKGVKLNSVLTGMTTKGKNDKLKKMTPLKIKSDK